MKKSLIDYLEYIDTEEEFSYVLRMEYVWHPDKFEKLVSLLRAVIIDYKDEIVIPKYMVWFFFRDVDIIIGITNNNIFFNTIPSGFSREEYTDIVTRGQQVLLELKNDFL